jgi:hypothetical protein
LETKSVVQQIVIIANQHQKLPIARISSRYQKSIIPDAKDPIKILNQLRYF